MFSHIPVLRREVVEALRCRPQAVYVDCTIGDGGHAEAVLEASAPDGFLIGIDRDAEAIRRAGERLKRFERRLSLYHDHFHRLEPLLSSLGFPKADGILMDLGVSTLQLMDPERGFSIQKDGPLDMRMDQRSPVTAADLVNSLPEFRLIRILSEYGEERYARRIARAIVQDRRRRPVSRTGQLADLIGRAVPARARSGRIHPATRSFQALRIAVNQELDHLDASLHQAVRCLKPGGRLCVISFHSLEDRIVKNTFRAMARADRPMIRLVTKKPIVAGRDEVQANPRSRSAKLRVVERLAHEDQRQLKKAA